MGEVVFIRVRFKTDELSWGDYDSSVCGGIQKVHLRGHFEAEKKRRTVSKLFTKLGMHEKEVVFADWGDDEGMRSLDVASIIFLILWNQLATNFVIHGEVRFDICQASSCILFASEVQIHSPFYSFDFQSFVKPFLSGEILFQSQ